MNQPMFTRTALFEGKILEGQEDAFFSAVEERLLPIWQRLPRVQDVRLYKPVRRDADAPEIFLVLEIDYPSIEAIEEAMASPERELAKSAHEAIMPMYEGRHYHLVSLRLANFVAASG